MNTKTVSKIESFVFFQEFSFQDNRIVQSSLTAIDLPILVPMLFLYHHHMLGSVLSPSTELAGFCMVFVFTTPSYFVRSHVLRVQFLRLKLVPGSDPKGAKEFSLSCSP